MRRANQPTVTAITAVRATSEARLAKGMPTTPNASCAPTSATVRWARAAGQRKKKNASTATSRYSDAYIAAEPTPPAAVVATVIRTVPARTVRWYDHRGSRFRARHTPALTVIADRASSRISPTRIPTECPRPVSMSPMTPPAAINPAADRAITSGLATPG